MSGASIGARFLFSVAANAARALLSLVTGLIIARGLSPAGYGELTFLLGSFVAIRALLDLGSSSAFYTFISKCQRDRRFYLMYCGWLALQFALSLALVAVIFPQSVLDQIWLGQPRESVLLAMIAAFLQQQVWTTITQIGEAQRLTLRVQSLSLAIALAHLLLVALLVWSGLLSVPLVLLAIAGEILLASIVATKLLRAPVVAAGEISPSNTAETLRDYWRFCRPLIFVAVVGFLYDFADKWMLQKFAGSGQQGYYQIAAQLAAVSLLATTSIMNIFWKEIAHAGAMKDGARMAMLYTRVTRGLVLLGAAVSGFLIPWSAQLVDVLLGAAYSASWPILALMLLYPIHQSMGQVNATMYLASERTGNWMLISIAGQLVSLPVSYFMLAPKEGYLIPGLALGALGLAIKMVVMNALLTNVQAKLLAGANRWKFHWLWQLPAIGGLLLLGYAARGAAVLLIPDADSGQPLALAIGLSLAGVLYLPALALYVRTYPWLLGCARGELQELARRFLPATLARFA